MNKTVAIIGARLTSSRLPGKQLLPLIGKPVIGHIVDRLKAVPSIDQILIATTDDPSNAALCDWAKENNVTAFAWDGDVNDVVGRVDAAIRNVDADTIVYVCGDCPLIEPSTIHHLIKGSGYVSSNGLAMLQPAKSGRDYIHEGFDVFNRGFWNRMVDAAQEPFEREHIGAVYHHLKKVKPDELLLVDEDPKFAEVNHRLSVDTAQDYDFMNSVYQDWYAHNDPTSLVNLKWLVEKLKTDANLRAINAHVHQKSVKEVAYKIQVLCEAGQEIGLGHLSRACVITSALQEHIGADVDIQIRGEKNDYSKLTHIRHSWVNAFDDISQGVDAVIVDVKNIDAAFAAKLKALPQSVLKVGIDQSSDSDPQKIFDQIWMPSICVSPLLKKQAAGRLRYGLDCFLLGQSAMRLRPVTSSVNKSAVILTGGSDPANFASFLPDMLDNVIPDDSEITWIQGPYANAPLWNGREAKFKTVKSPPNLAGMLHEFDYALCVFGVTFFECLRAGVPTIVFDPLGAATKAEWRFLADMVPGLVAKNLDDALIKLERLHRLGASEMDPKISKALADGPQKFAVHVANCLQEKLGSTHAAA